MSKVGKVFFINSNALNIRYWKNNYLTFWFHKPVNHLPRLYASKFEFCGKQFYLDDKDDKKILGFAEEELYEIAGKV